MSEYDEKKELEIVVDSFIHSGIVCDPIEYFNRQKKFMSAVGNYFVNKLNELERLERENE